MVHFTAETKTWSINVSNYRSRRLGANVNLLNSPETSAHEPFERQGST